MQHVDPAPPLGLTCWLLVLAWLCGVTLSLWQGWKEVKEAQATTQLTEMVHATMATPLLKELLEFRDRLEVLEQLERSRILSRRRGTPVLDGRLRHD